MMTMLTSREWYCHNEGQKHTTRNFITYLHAPGEENFRADLKVRVNCKYEPKDTAITYPHFMQRHAKTTLGHVRHSEKKWVVLQDREWPNEVQQEEDWGHDIDKMCILMQEPRKTSEGHASLGRLVRDDEEKDRVGTLSKKQRDLINDGIDTIDLRMSA